VIAARLPVESTNRQSWLSSAVSSDELGSRRSTRGQGLAMKFFAWPLGCLDCPSFLFLVNISTHTGYFVVNKEEY
jgi:hypothetical protein